MTIVLPVLALEVGISSHVGRVRHVNEDAYFAGSRLFAIADGMGGHHAGDVASRTTIDVLAELDRGPVSTDELRASIGRANAALVEYGHTHPEGSGLGTTLAGIALVTGGGAPHWVVFHIGDSRVYQRADDILRQLTIDHSEIEELIAAGKVARQQAGQHPARHVVTRAIGETPAPELDMVLLPAAYGQRWLITSDGLTSELDEATIAGLLASGESASLTATHLVEAALVAGGRDNVSVIVVDVVDAALVVTDETTVPRGRREVGA